MAKCKKDGCREEAVPFEKRYCVRHLDQYKRRRAEALERELAKPLCSRCGHARVREEGDLCRECAEIKREENAMVIKARSFYDVKTVEELKEWMIQHMGVI